METLIVFVWWVGDAVRAQHKGYRGIRPSACTASCTINAARW